jgi:hypothetical protein
MMLTTIRCSRVDGHGSVSPCVRAPPPPAAASLQGEPAAASQCSCLLVPTTARRLHALTLVMILFADHPSRFRCIPVASPTLLSLSRPTTATSPRIRVLGVGWVLPCCSLSRDSRPLSITSICHRRWRVAFTSCASGVAGSRWRGRERERAKRGAHGMPRGGERQRRAAAPLMSFVTAFSLVVDPRTHICTESSHRELSETYRFRRAASSL